MADLLQSWPCFLKLIPGVLGRLVNFEVPKRFLGTRPMFPEYLSVSCDYDNILVSNRISASEKNALLV